MVPGRTNAVEVGDEILLVAVGRAHPEELTITEDRSQRCAQFMAHIGQKGCLSAAGGLSGLLRTVEFRFDLFALCDVAQDDQPPGHKVVLVIKRRYSQIIVARSLPPQYNLVLRLGRVTVALDKVGSSSKNLASGLADHLGSLATEDALRGR